LTEGKEAPLPASRDRRTRHDLPDPLVRLLVCEARVPAPRM